MSAPHALHHQKCHRGAGGETPPPPWCFPPLICHAPATLGRGAGVSGPFFSPLAQAGQPLGLSPTGIQAGAEPPTPCGAGQGERCEGRRREGRSSTGLAALGPQRGGCSVWLLRAFPLLPPHLPAGRARRQGVRGEVRAVATNGGQSLAPAPRIGWFSSRKMSRVPSLHPLVPKQFIVCAPLGHICVARFLQLLNCRNWENALLAPLQQLGGEHGSPAAQAQLLPAVPAASILAQCLW